MSTLSDRSFGQLLRYWRAKRRLSQLELANESDVSARHISFLETGRAHPSREMILLLGEVLDLSLRDRNALMYAAGFAPVYRETDFHSPELSDVRRAVEFILERHNPNPAVAMDYQWNVLDQNRAATALIPLFVADFARLETPLNLVELLFSDAGCRRFIVNWDEAASSIIQRLHRERMSFPSDTATGALLDRMLARPDIPSDWRTPRLSERSSPILPLHFKRDDTQVKLFSAITTLGTPLDITAYELRLETFFPADPASARVLLDWAK